MHFIENHMERYSYSIESYIFCLFSIVFKIYIKFYVWCDTKYFCVEPYGTVSVILRFLKYEVVMVYVMVPYL